MNADIGAELNTSTRGAAIMSSYIDRALDKYFRNVMNVTAYNSFGEPVSTYPHEAPKVNDDVDEIPS